MKPLTPDDLLPLEEYAARRRELFGVQTRYLDRYRRVRLGPRLTLLFANRQTLWFQVQEVLRVARIAEPALIQAQLDIYNRLLPTRNRLQAAVLIAVADEANLAKELTTWRELRGEDLRLHLGRDSYAADLLTCRPEDRAIGAAHWAQFVLGAAGRRLLGDFRTPAHFSVSLSAYCHDSEPLADEVRRSLWDDLEASDRDAA
jgi:hypothetical protein